MILKDPSNPNRSSILQVQSSKTVLDPGLAPEARSRQLGVCRAAPQTPTAPKMCIAPSARSNQHPKFAQHS